MHPIKIVLQRSAFPHLSSLIIYLAEILDPWSLKNCAGYSQQRQTQARETKKKKKKTKPNQTKHTKPSMHDPASKSHNQLNFSSQTLQNSQPHTEKIAGKWSPHSSLIES